MSEVRGRMSEVGGKGLRSEGRDGGRMSEVGGRREGTDVGGRMSEIGKGLMSEGRD